MKKRRAPQAGLADCHRHLDYLVVSCRDMVQLLNDPSGRLEQVVRWLETDKDDLWDNYSAIVATIELDLRRYAEPTKNYSKPYSRTSPGLHPNPNAPVLERAASLVSEMLDAMRCRDRTSGARYGKEAISVLKE